MSMERALSNDTFAIRRANLTCGCGLRPRAYLAVRDCRRPVQFAVGLFVTVRAPAAMERLGSCVPAGGTTLEPSPDKGYRGRGPLESTVGSTHAELHADDPCHELRTPQDPPIRGTRNVIEKPPLTCGPAGRALDLTERPHVCFATLRIFDLQRLSGRT